MEKVIKDLSSEDLNNLRYFALLTIKPLITSNDFISFKNLFEQHSLFNIFFKLKDSILSSFRAILEEHNSVYAADKILLQSYLQPKQFQLYLFIILLDVFFDRDNFDNVSKSNLLLLDQLSFRELQNKFLYFSSNEIEKIFNISLKKPNNGLIVYSFVDHTKGIIFKYLGEASIKNNKVILDNIQINEPVYFEYSKIVKSNIMNEIMVLDLLKTNTPLLDLFKNAQDCYQYEATDNLQKIRNNPDLDSCRDTIFPDDIYVSIVKNKNFIGTVKVRTEYTDANKGFIYGKILKPNNLFPELTKNSLLPFRITKMDNNVLICTYVEETYKKYLVNSLLQQDIDTTLYIYKGYICCHKYNHNIISATASLHNISDKDIEINVEYCKDCGKYLLSYDQFLHYREKYGVLIGNFKIVSNDFFEGETDLAEESPLHLSGYNVGQKDDFSSNERHYILARIIHDGIMKKPAVLNYLSYFVRMNGARRNMELAVAKWKEDITFVQNYNMSTQPRTIITKITRY